MLLGVTQKEQKLVVFQKRISGLTGVKNHHKYMGWHEHEVNKECQ